MSSKQESFQQTIHGHERSLVPVPAKIGGILQPHSNPAYLQDRLKLFQELHAKQQISLAQAPKNPIQIILKDGKVLQGISFESCPFDIAKQISKKVVESSLLARIIPLKDKSAGISAEIDIEAEADSISSMEEGEMLWDMMRPLEFDCKLELLDINHPAAKKAFWHSSAHLLGEVLEQEFGGYLCVGPPVENGFYYDMYLGGHNIHPAQYDLIQRRFDEICRENQSFQRVVVSKKEALELFKYNPFKCQLIDKKIPENGSSSVYRCGSLVDLCSGPHIPSSNYVKAFKVVKSSGAYWLGESENDELQRVYGISFDSEKDLKKWEKDQEDNEKRNHRIIGPRQGIFEFHPLSPGAPFFLPHGALIYNKLISFIRKQYAIRGYSEVLSPNIFNSHLFEISGHMENYRENMYFLQHDKQSSFALKPMNCPGHCLCFGMHQRSYRDLPIRYADFGVLHRHEVSGALSGLVRVLRFCQDDAHIFCAPDQILDEIMAQLEFVKYCYDLFGFSFKLGLSTRPENYLGSIEMWEKAEAILADALNRFGMPWKINKGDGAFYGPKIDILLSDALKREHQCATLQLDFQLPLRFNLQYRVANEEQASDLMMKPRDDLKSSSSEEEKKEVIHEHSEHEQHHCGEQSAEGSSKYVWVEQPLRPGFQRPVIIHRAVFGSFERFLAVCLEHFAGNWPFWLSPRQAIIVPVSDIKHMAYSDAIYWRLKSEGYNVELDRSNHQLVKKIRNAHLLQYNYILVVGDKEIDSELIDVRSRDGKERIGKMGIVELLNMFKKLEPSPSSVEQRMMSKAFRAKSERESASSGHIQDLSESEKQVLNDELLLKVFLSDDGFIAGDRDEELFKRVSKGEIEVGRYPNLFRWQMSMRKLKSSKG